MAPDVDLAELLETFDVTVAVTFPVERLAFGPLAAAALAAGLIAGLFVVNRRNRSVSAPVE